MSSNPIVAVGRNCWQIARADAASVVVDAADYYHYARLMMESARSEILIIGWDFDPMVDLEPDERGAKYTLARFFLDLAKSDPERRIRILKWSFGAKKQFLKIRSAWALFRWWRTPAIDFKFDAAHPAGCSHHQKLMLVDRCMAACGGIDIALGRWDTPLHNPNDPRRSQPGKKDYPPWHDATMILGGDAAAELADLGQDRWRSATGADLEDCPRGKSQALWPDGLERQFENVDVAITRTVAPYGEKTEVREIEQLYLDMTAAAKDHIYFENQYFTAGKIGAAIAQRMEEDDPPEFVFVMPRQADGWLEQRAMDAARIRLSRAIGKIDRFDRFRIYVPVNSGDEDIYVHAKVAIVDDRLIRVGSSNINNRSLGLDSECDVTIDAGLPGNAAARPQIAATMHRLLAEHLGSSPHEVAAIHRETGSLAETIDRLNRPDGRRLELLDLEKPSEMDKFIADNLVLDPEHPDGFLEPLSKRSLWRNWRGRRGKQKGQSAVRSGR